MLTRRRFLKLGLAAGAAAVLSSRDRQTLRALAAAPEKGALSSSGFTIRAAPYPNWPLQTGIDPTTIPQFVEKLPDLKFIPDTGTPLELQMREFKYNMLPRSFTLPNGQPYDGTWVWGYRTPDQDDSDANANSYIGPVIIATRGQPTEIKFVNQLGTGANTKVKAYKYSVDQTLHWASPEGMITGPDGNMCMDPHTGVLPEGSCSETYQGPIPTVPHLHGGEVPAYLDGGPDAWFTSDGQFHGKTFYSKDGSQSNYCIYRYPNQQEAALIWFHDHTLGATRVNVFCGLAGAYLLTDPNLVLPKGLSTMPTVPLVIQDRTFDTEGQVLLPAGGPDNPNPEHPYWIPEFIGDTIVVNGKTWPYLEVEPRRYRFLIINGSNARGYELFVTNKNENMWAPPIWQIGTDGGYLDTAVKIDPRRMRGPMGGAAPSLPGIPGPRPGGSAVNGGGAAASGGAAADGAASSGDALATSTLSVNGADLNAVLAGATAASMDGSFFTGKGLGKLVLMPGERADIIIDFSGLKGQTLYIRNTGSAPLPDGDPVDPDTTGKILQFRVTKPLSSRDTSYNPAYNPTIRQGKQRINRLFTLPSVIRQLTLNEVIADPKTAIDPITGLSRDYEGGPLEILVNNTSWSGRLPMGGMPMEGMPREDFTPDKVADLSELPQEGATELWEIVNLTMDTHPIHLHLVQFQLVGRQAFDMEAYMMAYAAAFPGSEKMDPKTGMPYPPGVYIPSFGPPLNYNTYQPLSSSGAGPNLPILNKLGGNPDVWPFLQGAPQLPKANEFGWKDTIQCPPNMVTRFMVRFAPTSLPANQTGTYPFDPGNEGGQGSDYVWHCHIIDHEDNEMMRPYTVQPAPGAVRTYVKGKDF